MSGVVTRKIGGVIVGAHWIVKDEIVTVRSPLGSKATQVGGSPPQLLAAIMLRELYEDTQP